MLWAQAGLVGAMAASALGSCAALLQPNPNPSKPRRPASDSIHGLNLTHKHWPKMAMAPVGLLTLHACGLALTYPSIPRWLLGHGADNGLNPDLFTWSPSTGIPLALLLGVGIPLRLAAYASLGANFTYALAEPDRLQTTGIYRYVQHPSYTALALLIWANVVLLARMDGPLGCLLPPSIFGALHKLHSWLAPVAFSVFLSLMRTRVLEEERMLEDKFGEEWRRWHARTARFIPGIW
ncbi:isoprenylcysteine carboxyl methyltransferase [Stachybotrys elegans]|uniref:Protein-S-isoprenylcysteine O-methyltransferase n=1 Tax=Stachybotrys elegans TaxID=80388 RepID=A0A8K0WVA0_9HYPO|nr:isoprenylcysteine carboxyl methyltransferase [Stachybotrys elegans]